MRSGCGSGRMGSKQAARKGGKGWKARQEEERRVSQLITSAACNPSCVFLLTNMCRTTAHTIIFNRQTSFSRTAAAETSFSQTVVDNDNSLSPRTTPACHPARRQPVSSYDTSLSPRTTPTGPPHDTNRSPRTTQGRHVRLKLSASLFRTASGTKAGLRRAQTSKGAGCLVP